MNKKIISGILLLLAATSIILYRKYQKAEAKAQQELLGAEANERYLQDLRNKEIAEQKTEVKRISDSIVQKQNDEMRNGLQILKEASESLDLQ